MYLKKLLNKDASVISEEASLMVTECTYMWKSYNGKIRLVCKRLETYCLRSEFIDNSLLKTASHVDERTIKNIFEKIYLQYGVFIEAPILDIENSMDSSISFMLQSGELSPTTESCLSVMTIYFTSMIHF
ncbi:uncharacterized protein T551_02942 [Pneumocystis jirovecii RU7]|uniref:Uncharacterized protein n=1 Tax=Pneumocystis jirovecii (strain RU7) TaxID=1408657 RepID=A0A0W4ZHW5_PNEJ7|nr:uncharacterized protein T551_02942 [Pneumocystis jirovecii RU7]KTW27975.1 hypothetical protein T551_02942 [Pneumocystis jirovecii RU7]